MLLGPLGGGSYAAVVIQGLTPSSTSPQPVGTNITWTVSATDAQPGSLDYQFGVKTPTTDFTVVRDFSPSASFEWTPTETEGGYEIRVVARNTGTQETARRTAAYAVSSRVVDGSPAVNNTAHPLVALYSAPACEGGRMRVRFSPSADASAMQATQWKPCRPGVSMNFYVAGMRANTEYTLRHEVIPAAASPRIFGPLMSFTTGSLPSGVFPAYSVTDPPDDSAAGILLYSPFSPYLLRATDLSGTVLWYYDAPATFFTRPSPGGTFFIIQDVADFIDTLTEVDLAGNTVRQTNIHRVSEQLVAKGARPITSFHHEAVRLPDGKLLVLCSNERILTGVQSSGTDYIIGDVIVVLDENLQVVWSWDAFDHLDVTRKAIGDGAQCYRGPYCVTSSPGVANDWLHSNSVSYVPSDGNLIMSIRHQDWVIKIDYADGDGTGNVLWRLGKDGDFTLDSTDPYPWFSHQHDAEFDGGAVGRMSLFDNGNARQGLSASASKNSRGQVYEIDEANRTATLYMNTDLGGYSFAVGSAQRLAGGGYHFLSGFLPGNRSQSIGVGEGGLVNYRLDSDVLSYRSFRMRDLYTLDTAGTDSVKEDQTINFAQLADKIYAAAPFALSATTTSGLPAGFHVVSGPAEVSGNTLTITGAGEVVVRAQQAGDGYFNAAQPVERSFKVGKAAAAVALSNLNQTYDGSTKTPTAATDPPGLNIILTYTRNGLRVASPTDAGTYDVAAAVNDPNYEGGAAGTLVIGKANQTIDFAQPSGKTFGDAPFELSAAASSGLTLSFVASGPCGVAGVTVHITGAGTCAVTATQAGGANYNPAADVRRSFTINKAGSTTTVTAPDATYDGGPHGATATVTGFGGLDQGLTVTYAGRNGTSYGPSATAPTNAGDYTASANFPGDADHAGSSGSADFRVLKAGQSITFAALPNRTFGDADFGVSATAGPGLGVSFAASGQCTVSGATVRLAGAGSCTVTASQAGDNNYSAAPNVERSFQIAKGATQAALSSSVNPSDLGQPVTFTAAVSAGAGAPAGSVTFKDGAATLGTRTLDGAGVATFTTSALAAGAHAITAEYAGGPDHLASAGTLPGGQTVKGAPTLSVSDVTLAEGDAGTKDAVFTVSLSAASGLGVSANFATSNGTAAAPGDYEAAGGTLSFAPGETSKAVTVKVRGDSLSEPDETFAVSLSGPANAVVGAAGTGTIVNDDAAGGVLSFSAAHYNVAEGAGSVVITVERAGDTSGAAGVGYATDDGGAPGVFVPCAATTGAALERCDFAAAAGRLDFAAGETSKAFSVLVTDDAYAEGPEALSLVLGDPAGGAVLGGAGAALLNITDNDITSSGNPLDITESFVRQHYHDFLNREPDTAGLAFWTNEINSCGADAGCVEARRVNVSAAFFLSIEFQNTGYLAYRANAAAFGPARVGGVVPVASAGFLPDVSRMGRGVVVGAAGWEARLEANKREYFREFVGRPAFKAAFPPSLTPGEFVDALGANAGGALSRAERDALVAELTANDDDGGRASVLRKVADDADLRAAHSGRAFVLMQYFGYLRRDPDAAPDSDFSGYSFWLSKLGEFGGDFVRAEMVKAFITSDEYRRRFGR